MAWSLPSSRSTGALITAAIWNQDVVDNPIALRAGGIAIASQAAYDLIYASSASQLARLANGTTGQVLLATTGAAPSWGSAGAVPYTATLADVTSNVETDCLHFTVPANAWSDGDLIWVSYLAIFKNNKGTSGTVTFKVNVGAGSQVTMATPTADDDATEYRIKQSFSMMRTGTTVALSDGFGGALTGNPIQGDAVLGTSTPTDFTSANVVTLKVTLSATDAAFYFKLLTGGIAKVVHFKA